MFALAPELVPRIFGLFSFWFLISETGLWTQGAIRPVTGPARSTRLMWSCMWKGLDETGCKKIDCFQPGLAVTAVSLFSKIRRVLSNSEHVKTKKTLLAKKDWETWEKKTINNNTLVTTLGTLPEVFFSRVAGIFGVGRRKKPRAAKPHKTSLGSRSLKKKWGARVFSPIFLTSAWYARLQKPETAPEKSLTLRVFSNRFGEHTDDNGDHLRRGDHFRSGIICGNVHLKTELFPIPRTLIPYEKFLFTLAFTVFSLLYILFSVFYLIIV